MAMKVNLSDREQSVVGDALNALLREKSRLAKIDAESGRKTPPSEDLLRTVNAIRRKLTGG